MMQSGKLRVLVISHGHPAIGKGGGEIAAHNLYTALRAHPNTKAWFLGCDRTHRHTRLGAVLTQPFSASEYLYAPGAFDWFKFANRDPKFPQAFTTLLTELQPTIIHFHHYAHIGVEAIEIARRVLPDVRIVLTLHEYLAICHHYGQMMTVGERLCHAASPQVCHACFPKHDPQDFFLRRLYLDLFLDQVDAFISPSRFLAQRYAEWGLCADRILLIENVVAGAQPGTRVVKSDTTLRVGFFGQISWLKGAEILFDAAAILEREAADISFHIHADHRSQMPEFQDRFLNRLQTSGANVTCHGPYENDAVDDLMASVDVVLVPSVWWENAPIVIAEAIRNRVPVICSDIGGMAEKVRDGMDGLHFKAGDARSLVVVLRALIGAPERLAELRRTMAMPVSAEWSLNQHVRLYRRLSEADRLSASAAAD